MIKKLVIAILFIIPAGITAQPVQPLKSYLFSETSQHNYLLQDLTGTNVKKILRDTFYIYSRYKETVHIKNIHTQQNVRVEVDKKIPSQKETPVYVEITLVSQGVDFANQSFSVSLELEDKSYVSFGIQVPIISGNTTVYYNSKGLVQYAIGKSLYSKYNTAILAYPDGSLRAKGLVQDKDTSLKMGRWDYYTPGRWQMDTIAYTKELRLTAYNQYILHRDDGYPPPFKVKVRENNTWKEAVTESYNYATRLFYTAATDSVIAYTDSTAFGFPVSFSNMETTSNRQFYLLRPGERTLKVGQNMVPFGTIKNTYAIILRPTHVTPQRTYKAIEDSFYQALHKQYPKLAQVFINKYQQGIALIGMSAAEEKQLLTYLEKSRLVGFVCQLFTMTDVPKQFYCDNQLYVELNNYNKLDELKQAASGLGFTFSRSDGYASNRHWFVYKSKITDEAFFAAFKKLTEHPLVATVYPNTYTYAEPDMFDNDKGLMKQW